MRWTSLLAVVAGCGLNEGLDEGHVDSELANNVAKPNSLGAASTFSTAGAIDLDSTFFEPLGTNGRHCGTCHDAGQGWSLSTAGIRDRYLRTKGADPLFRGNDGAVSPDANLARPAARWAAYALLRSRGVFRVGLAMPPDPEFDLVAVDDPYEFASATELSLFRRPLPATNLTLISTVMWDGRIASTDLHAALLEQANAASVGHAQAEAPIDAETEGQIVDFESALFSAQLELTGLGRLDAGAAGGPEALASQPFVAGAFDLYDGWTASADPAQQAIARGQALFNTKTRPGGGACRSCHAAANVGSSTSGLFFDVGISQANLDDGTLPVYWFKNKTTNEVRRTTDPGRALITGAWTDMDRFKVPQLRSLASRAPYFHDGSARTLREVVQFYERSLGFVFTAAERDDLVAFLSAL